MINQFPGANGSDFFGGKYSIIPLLTLKSLPFCTVHNRGNHGFPLFFTEETMDFHTCFVCLPEGSSYTPPKPPKKLDHQHPIRKPFFFLRLEHVSSRLGKSSSAGSLAAVGLGNMMQNCALAFDKLRASKKRLHLSALVLSYVWACVPKNASLRKRSTDDFWLKDVERLNAYVS